MNQSCIIQEIIIFTSRSGGKGGQHVNKTESKVEIHFNLKASNCFAEDEKEWLEKKLANKLKDGILIVTNQESRSQIKNKENAIKKLMEILRKSLVKPKKRKPTKPSAASKAKTRKTKEHRKEIKAGRKKIY